MKKIMIAMGNFKDTYTAVEMCDLLEDLLQDDYEIIKLPICDGGESTSEVLRWHFNFELECAENILDARLHPLTVHYLKRNDEVYIMAYDVIRLKPEEDDYRNPLELSDYGLGQVVLDAIRKGYKKINLCIGGTSTVGCGIGFAQALGAKTYTKDGKCLENPIRAKELKEISRIEFDRNTYADVQMQVIADGVATYREVEIATELKIGRKYEERKQMILQELSAGIENVAQVMAIQEQLQFSGPAGCLFFGIKTVFDAVFYNGADYFLDLFGLDEKRKDVEMVFTGEGRLDNIKSKKGAVVLSKRCSQKAKVIYFCGQADDDLMEEVQEKDKIRLEIQQELGADRIVVLQQKGKQPEMTGSYEEKMKWYREYTPRAIKEELEKMCL